MSDHPSVDHSLSFVALGEHTVVAVRWIDAEGLVVLHSDRTAVVDQEGQLGVPLVFTDQRAKVAKPDAKVRFGLVQAFFCDTAVEVLRGWEHYLSQADRTHGARGPGIELALQCHQAEAELWIDALGDCGLEDVAGEVRRNPET